MLKVVEQIKLMKHAIGCEPKRIKRGKYKYFRNYFCCFKPDELWENLCENGFATKRAEENAIYYFVSENGIKLLEQILSIKIEEMR